MEKLFCEDQMLKWGYQAPREKMMTSAKMETGEVMGGSEALPLLLRNPVSPLCRSVWDSVRFYEDVLGFVLIKRPSSFDFNGARLYNYGKGIHLIENPSIEENDAIDEPRPINPKDNHMSFRVSLIQHKSPLTGRTAKHN